MQSTVFLILESSGRRRRDRSHDDFLLLAENCAEPDEHRIERIAAFDRLEIAEQADRFYTLYTITMISVFLKLIGSMRFPLHDPLVAALIGGALMGVAMGFIMKGEGTLAGSTILARIVNKFFGIKTGSAMLCFDLMVAIPSAVIIGFENMLLTIVELYLSAVILNKLLAQFVEKRSLTIISERFRSWLRHCPMRQSRV